MPMSPEARARLAARNKSTKPWEMARNTGPKSVEGRKRIAQNAFKHGARSSGMLAASNWLKTIRQLITHAL